MEQNKTPLAKLIEEIIEHGELSRDQQLQVNQLALGIKTANPEEVRALRDLTDKIGNGQIKLV